MGLFLFIFFWFLVGVLALVLFAWLVLGLRIQIISEEKRLVIYRLGAFNRVAGPGLVMFTRMDTIERELDVRDEPHNVRVDGLFIKGVPFGYTLNFWYGIDLKETAKGDHARLAHMAQFSNEEINRQVSDCVRDTLVSSLAQIEKEYKPAGTEFFHNILPIIPGLPESTKLLGYLKKELSQSLRAIGVIFDPNHPIIIKAIHVGDDIAGSFSRGRVVQVLKEQFPDLSQEILLQALTSIEGVDFAQQRITLKNEGDSQAMLDFRLDEEGEMRPRVKVYPQSNPSRASQPQPQVVHDEPAPPIVEKQLTKEDLSVLKRIPA